MRTRFVYFSISSPTAVLVLAYFNPLAFYIFIPLFLIIGVGYFDYFQIKHSVLRNFPILGRVRYIFESIRPEIHQYFIESNSEGRPFSREERTVIYQRAKGVLSTQPFGTHMDLQAEGYEFYRLLKSLRKLQNFVVFRQESK